jgi:O-antigen/teichoic acid export membrane protein
LSSLKDKAIKGFFWSLIERFGNQLIQFIIGLILARLLTPNDYGLLGMILIFISLAQVFSEGGFSAALIRKSRIRNIEYSTVFWFNLVISLSSYAILFITAPYISQFFNEPQLNLLVKIVSLNVIINSLAYIQKTILIKELNFKSQAKINLGSILISGLFGVLMAIFGLGVWALVIQTLIRNSIVCVFFWIQSEWKPNLVFSKTAFKNLYAFGSKLMLSSLINVISENLHSIIIGKLFSAKSLGFYTRANQFQKLPVSSIYGAISAVSYPVLSELQSDVEKLRSGYRKMIKLIGFVLFPIMAILAAVSDQMIYVVLTDKWMPASEMLKVLCIIGLFYPFHAINLDVLKVKGRSDLFLKLEIIKQFFNVLIILISFGFGIMGLIWGTVVLNVICFIINAWYSDDFINYGMVKQVKDLSVFFVISVFVYGLLYLFNLHFPHPRLYLILAPITGLCIYAFVAYIFKLEERYTIIEIVKKMKKR